MTLEDDILRGLDPDQMRAAMDTVMRDSIVNLLCTLMDDRDAIAARCPKRTDFPLYSEMSLEERVWLIALLFVDRRRLKDGEDIHKIARVPRATSLIRRATDADMGAVLRLAGRMWGAAPALRNVPLDSERVANVLYRLVAAGTLLVVDADGDSEVVGFLVYIVAPDPWTERTVATEVALYVAPEARGEGYAGELLRVAEAHARDAGAESFVAGTSLGDPSQAAAVAYARAGFAETGRTYRKALVARVPVA